MLLMFIQRARAAEDDHDLGRTGPHGDRHYTNPANGEALSSKRLGAILRLDVCFSMERLHPHYFITLCSSLELQQVRQLYDVDDITLLRPLYLCDTFTPAILFTDFSLKHSSKARVSMSEMLLVRHAVAIISRLNLLINITSPTEKPSLSGMIGWPR